jgi:hypothetical protein
MGTCLIGKCIWTQKSPCRKPRHGLCKGKILFRKRLLGTVALVGFVATAFSAAFRFATAFSTTVMVVRITATGAKKSKRNNSENKKKVFHNICIDL